MTGGTGLISADGARRGGGRTAVIRDAPALQDRAKTRRVAAVAGGAGTASAAPAAGATAPGGLGGAAAAEGVPPAAAPGAGAAAGPGGAGSAALGEAAGKRLRAADRRSANTASGDCGCAVAKRSYSARAWT